MRWLLILPVLLLVINLPAQSDVLVNALDTTRLSPEQRGILFTLMQAFPDGGEAAVALVEGDGTTYYGVRREDGRLVTVDNADGAFGIGSISKVFTATLLADAVQRGIVSLDAAVNAAYPFPFRDGTRFTYAELASHTAGLPRLPNNMPGIFLSPGNPYGDYTGENLEEYLRTSVSPLPNGGGGYSNLGFGILGYTLLHRLDSSSYDKALQEHIFRPLGMTHSAGFRDTTRLKLVPGLNTDGSAAAYWHFTDAMAGAGAVVSTPRDLIRFLRAQLDSTQAALALTRRPVVRLDEGRRAVGLGWQIRYPEDGQTVYWHNGGVGGYRSFVALDVEHARGVVVLTNVLLMSDQLDRTGFQLLRSLEGAR